MKRIAPILLLFIFLFITKGKLCGQCSADFKVISAACGSTGVSFKANDSSASLKYEWNFGDIFSGFDNLDTLANPGHAFTKKGTYTVTLIVNDTNGCTDTILKTINIFGKPQASFLWLNGCANMTTSFSDSSKADAGDTIKSWQWDFGNSSTSSQKNPQTTYTSAGTKTVKLIIVTAAGCTDTLKTIVTIFNKPTAGSNVTSSCKNAQVNFVANTISGAVSYRWDFGDSSFFSVRTVSHVYKKTGLLFPQLTVDFGTTKCTIALDSIVVHSLPDPAFILLNDTQCFNQNTICVKLINNKQKLKSRTVIFDDGSFDDATPLSDSIICHKFIDNGGGKYFLTMELIDSNNCPASFTATKPAVIHSQVKADFTYVGGKGCFNTRVSMTNKSNEAPPMVTNYLWDFGDGGKDSTHWTNFDYTYYGNGSFPISLWIKDKNGCTDKYTDVKTVSNTSFVVDAIMDSTSGKCKNNNYFHFKQTPIAGATIRWDFEPPMGISSGFSTQHHFLRPGLYYPIVTITKNGCDSIFALDSVIVHGPDAVIGNIINRFQCQIKDTVYYTNSSFLFQNKSIKVLWDAGDSYAANCTTNTKKSINVGMNCRYSSDSLFFKHKYKKGQEACYFVKLVVADTVLGCRDSASVPIPLMAPKAKGFFTPSDTTPCPGPEAYKTLTFDLNQSQPSCFKYAWWLMWDSLSAVKSGNFNSKWQANSRGHRYDYLDFAGDSSGNVTIGLIVENGLDTNGKVCRDTGWFHHNVMVIRMSPIFNTNYNPKKYYCPNSAIRFFPVDSNQTSGTQFLWNFGDGQTLSTTNQHSVSHVYKKAGKYLARLSVTSPSGCVGDTMMWINIGVFKNFMASTSLQCVYDSLQLFENNHYYDTVKGGLNYWSDPLRAMAGKEQVLYNLGDGNGFQYLGGNPKVKYPYPGIYNISMALRDSAGCWDTLAGFHTVRISGVYSNFLLPGDSILCGQTLDLKSLASTIDSSVNKGLTGDFVKFWEWDFGTRYAKSYIPNPKRYFTIGDYSIKLKVTNAFGCIDSVIKNLVLIGPKARYDFISDTIGCEPLMVTFKNKSQDATDYIWVFGDISKSAFSTASDSNISFKYLGHGNFYPQLIARGLFTKNGASQVCEEVYPDTTGLSMKRTVTVWELPKPKFTWFTNCTNSTTTFTNASTIVTGSIVSYQWFFGDGSGSNNPDPTHIYADTGSYRVVLKIISNHGCEDSLVKTVVVSPMPYANFTFNVSCKGSISLFKDSSLAYNDKIYLWKWEMGDGKKSNLRNPSNLYASDTIYPVKLKVTNVAGCSDSIIKQIKIYSYPKAAFGFSNVCDQSDMNFSNNSSSKDSLKLWKWDFGDNTSSGLWNTNHIYTGPANYQVKLKLETLWGCKDSVKKTVNVYPNPVAKISINQKTQCYKYHDFRLADSSKIVSGTMTSRWTLGNADSSNLDSFNYRYANYGNYGIRLISVSNFNCRDTVYDSVKVYAMPTVNFSVNQNNQCVRYNSYSFINLGTIATGSYTRQWQLGDGNFSTSDTANHHYNDTGIFKPLLILTSNFGCKDTAMATINLWPMPVAQFVVTKPGQCFNNNNFVFTNTSTMAWGSVSHRWEFGDNTTSNGQHATHSYTAVDSFKVLLEETSVNNCKDSAFKTVEIYSMPQTAFRIDDSLQCLRGNTFNFKNNSKVSPGSLTYTWRFGDGSTSTQIDPQHSYTNFGTFPVTLVSLSSSGCYDSLSHPITVYPMPAVKPIVNFSTGCINDQKFQFTDNSTIANGSISPTWKFGDTSFSFSKNPFKNFKYARTYTIWLSEVSDQNCIDSASLSVQVYPKPMPGFMVDDSSQCLTGNSFNFTNKTTIQSGSFTQTWKFGDGKSKTTANATNTYAAFGNYKATLIPVSNFGCKDSISANMIVYPMPAPSFSVNKSEQCIRQNQFVFTNNSTIPSGSLTHSWKFGDTGVSKVTSPKYIYTKYGNYTVKLISTSGFGCVDSTSQFMIVNPMPVSGFKINNTAQCVNDQNFIFTDSSFIASGSMSRKWKFDDGATSVLSPYNRTFIKDSLHSIKLVQTSDRGCLDSVSRMVVVHSKPNMAFTVNDSDQCLRQNNFVFTNKTNILKGTLTYQWDFGNLKTSTLTSPSHRYFNYATYTVTLKATSEKGCMDSLKKPMLVNPMPLVLFTINDTGQCINNQSFVFKNNSTIATGTITHLWKFGDGNTSTTADPIKQYAKDTSYTVILTETSNKGCLDSTQKMVDVYPKPNVNFSINNPTQCLFQNLFSFTNSSAIKYGTLSYIWNFGDGKTDNTTNPNHSYTAFGNYKVTLHSTSNLGCVDSNTKAVIVAPMPVVNYSVNDPGQCFRIQNFIFTNKSSVALGTISTKWYFGDLDTITSSNASHDYKTIGNYKPKIVVTTDFGCKDSITQSIWVNPNAKAAFVTNDSDQCKNQQNYIFTNISTVSPGQIASLLWNLGNGNTSTQQVVKSYYPQSGIYTIILQTTTDSGCVDSFTNRISVYPKPKAAFDINDSAQCLFQNNYLFTDISFDSLKVNQYYWDINSENQQNTKTANYIFGTPGYKTITLIATSLRGCSDTAIRQVYVKPMPDPKFETLKTYYCELTGPYTFLPVTPGGRFYGKNMELDTFKPVILWDDTVKYIITVNGCTDSSSQFTQVYPGPVVHLGHDSTLCKFEMMNISLNSWQSKYIWNDGSTSPIRRISEPGTYWVKVTNICGIKGDTLKVLFNDFNCRLFLPTAFSPNADGINDRYKPLIYNVEEMTYQIFNRWGELIYEGNEKDQGWDGSFMNEMVQVDNYLVYVSYSYTNGNHYVKTTQSGMFVLVR